MSDGRALTDDQEERLARYRAGVMSDTERASFEREALASDVLAEALYTEGSLDAVGRVVPADADAPRPSARVTPLPARRRLGSARVLLPLAAAVLAVSAVVLWQARTRQPQLGGDWVRGEGTITALEPSGDVTAAPQQFRWTRDPGAANYRVELFDNNGNVWGTAISRDTVLAFGAVARRPLDQGQWRVVAIGRDGLERPARSRASFRIVPR